MKDYGREFVNYLKAIFSGSAVGFSISGGTTSKTLTVADNCTVGGNAINPTLPAFQVRPTAKQENFAVGSYVTVVFGTEIFDQGGNFASNTFTAPVTGKYQFNVNLYVETLDSASNYHVRLNTSNRLYNFASYDFTKFSGDLAIWTFAASVLADMDAADTAIVEIYQEVGTVQTDIGIDSCFSGFLVA